MALPVVNASKYTTVIPSTGEEIEFRPFLVKEEKVLMVALESKDNKLIMRSLKDVLSACTFGTVVTDNLTSFDLEYLFLQLRSKAVGETADISLKCRNDDCDDVGKHSIPLEKITMDIPEKDDKIVMMTDDVGITFKYPSVKQLEKIGAEDLDTLSPEQKMEATMALILVSIDNIFDADNVYPADSETEQSLTGFIDGLNASQFASITEWFQGMPALSHTVEWKCNKCDNDNKVELRGLQNFFT